VRENRSFAITLAGGFLIVGLIALWRQRQQPATISLALSVVSLLAGLLLPGRLGPLRRAWMKIGDVISIVTTPVLMGAVYYLVFTPPGLLRRMRSRRRSKGESSWHKRAPLPPASRMERQF
jgi:hypothetical protein